MTETIAAVLKSEPDWAGLPGSTPGNIRRLLRRCFAKDQASRLRDIGDARLEIRESSEAGIDDEMAAAGTITPGLPRWHHAVPWAFVAILAGLTWWSLTRTSPSIPERPRHLTITIPESAPIATAESLPLGQGRPSIALSPDGTLVVYVAESDGITRLYQRSLEPDDSGEGLLEAPEAILMVGTEGAYSPFFSPNGQWIGFFAGTNLYKLSLQGGKPVPLCEVRNGFGAAWGSDGWIYFATQFWKISRVSADGGPAETVASNVDGLLFPQVLPGGRALLAAKNPRIHPGVVLISVESGETTVLVEGATSPLWVGTDHIIFAQGSSLFAQPFDDINLHLTGSPAHRFRCCTTCARSFWGLPRCISKQGSLAYLLGRSATLATPVWVDRQGRPESLGLPLANYGQFSLAPDGHRLAIVTFGAKANIRLHDLERGRQKRLTLEGNNHAPIWSPDGEWIVFSSDRSGALNLWHRRADGSGGAERLTSTTSGYMDIPYSWSGVCDCIFFGRYASDGRPRQGLLPASKGGDPEPVWESPSVVSEFTEWGHHLSPDGRWLAYVSDEPGPYEVFVSTYPPTGDKHQVSFGGGEEPLWSRDGRELFYRHGQRWMSVSVAPGPELELGNAILVFEGSYRPVWGYSYDVSPDGERFLLYKQVEQLSRNQINVVLKGFEELERLVPDNG